MSDDLNNWTAKKQTKQQPHTFMTGNNKITEISIDISDDVLLSLAMQAHEKDITLNKHLNNLIANYIDNNTNTEVKQFLTEKA